MAGNLFVLPKQVPIDSGVIVSGAKATFTKTGTTTPQDTFTDIALTVAHANPVIADSNGVFAAVYFDSSFDDYRLKLTDSSDVLIYQVDDIPASEAGQTLNLKAAAPYVQMIETDATANNGAYRIAANGDQLIIQLGNDALSSFADVLTIDRTANVIDDLQINGVSVFPVQGSFTATWVGFTTSETSNVQYTKIGNIVIMNMTGTPPVFTSNTTGLSFTGLPTVIQPTRFTRCMQIVQDNGTTIMGNCVIGPGSSVAFTKDATQSVAFTNSGSKGLTFIGDNWVYMLD